MATSKLFEKKAGQASADDLLSGLAGETDESHASLSLGESNDEDGGIWSLCASVYAVRVGLSSLVEAADSVPLPAEPHVARRGERPCVQRTHCCREHAGHTLRPRAAPGGTVAGDLT
eukprot:1299010-Prymnesium_polylepis.2